MDDEDALVGLLGLRGKAALVVGGGFGIGRASALHLAKAGANVAVADLDLTRAEAVAAEIEAFGRHATALTGDVTRRDDAEHAVEATVAAFGTIDVVVNMVGMAAWITLDQMDDQTWALDMARNLDHHRYVATAAAKRMIDSGTAGRIAVVASVSGVYGAPNHAAYGAAKAGLMSLVRTMAQEWGPHGIRVNAVAPDMIATPRMVGIDMQSNARRDGLPLGRAGTPEEIAGPLLFLVSDLSSFVTGQTVIVDGGMRSAFPHWHFND